MSRRFTNTQNTPIEALERAFRFRVLRGRLDDELTHELTETAGADPPGEADRLVPRSREESGNLR